MSESKRPSRWTVMIAGCLLCVVSVPLATYALRRNSELQSRYDKIAAMTESERKQLLFQYEEFKALSKEQKDHFRRMQAELDGDRRELKPTLESYREFLKTLNPVDRAEIESQSSPTDKIAVIDRIVGERKEALAQVEEAVSAVERFRAEYQSGGFHMPVLSVDDLLTMSDILEKSLPEDVQRKAKFGAHPRDVTRAAMVLSAAVKARVNSPTSPGMTPFDRGMLDDLKAAVQNEPLRERLDRSQDDRQMTRQVVRMMFFACGREQLEHPPTSQQLQELMNAKDQDNRNRLMAMRPHELYFELVREYINNNPNDLTRALAEIRPIVDAFPESRRPPRRDGAGNRGRGEGPDGSPPGDDPPRQDDPEGRRPRFGVPRGPADKNRPERNGPGDTNPAPESRN